MNIDAIKASFGDRFKETREDIQQIEAWIETHSGPFSINELSTKLEVPHELCREVVENHPLITIPDQERRKKPGPQRRYFSNGSEPNPTEDGLLEVEEIMKRHLDDKGKQAREDYWDLVTTRGGVGRRKYKVVKRF